MSSELLEQETSLPFEFSCPISENKVNYQICSNNNNTGRSYKIRFHELTFESFEEILQHKYATGIVYNPYTMALMGIGCVWYHHSNSIFRYNGQKTELVD